MGVNPKIKAVFLDRDGILNKAVIIDRKPFPPVTIKELEIPEGVKEGLLLLKKAGYLLIVITNQPDVSRKTTTEKCVSEMNEFLRNELPLDDIFCCFHDGNDNCSCRKPKPGMVFSASKKWNIDLSMSFLIGDRWRDIETGKNSGVRTILIDYHYDEKYVKPDFSCQDFTEATNIILSKK